MKIVNIILILTLIYSCDKKTAKEQKNEIIKNEIVKPAFQTIIDTHNVHGAILMYDLNKDLFYANDFKWAKTGRLPASTFKIPNSMIALETKVVDNDSTLFKWNGEKRAYKVWEQDLILKDAFKYSCVPCYQEIARKIGKKRMNAYLEKLNYLNMVVNSENLDLFWLEGASKINQFEQIDFLKRFYKSELKISKRTEAIMRKILFIEKNKKYTLYGKTGLSVRNKQQNGWFVGYAQSEENTLFFATNISPKETTDIKGFPKLRKEITLKALELIE
ncbi:class D beta-lactamase [Polaribacter staleyi]|uniref:class D beta-lactamase n=1 Tax=Polaribacter staleyi TaxID=2022337 RepID=UPI0031BB27E8